ncbi:MAG: hypothetical protein IJC86_02330 [Clostridia bacterium]|nr:hypothetical protein [Clostridia bacterium]
MKRLISVVLLILLCCTLTACGEKSEIVGTWRTYDLGVSIDSPELPAYFTFTFHENGSGSGPVSTLDRLDTATFTYEDMGDGTIEAVTDEGKSLTMKYTIDDDTMFLEINGYTRELERVSRDVLIECY